MIKRLQSTMSTTKSTLAFAARELLRVGAWVALTYALCRIAWHVLWVYSVIPSDSVDPNNWRNMGFTGVLFYAGWRLR